MQAQYDQEDSNDEEMNQEEAQGRDRRKNRGKKGKGRRRQRNNDGAGPNDFEFRDNNDIDLLSNDFGREHFRKLIKKTFDDYYPLEYNKSTFDMDEYLDVVAKEQLESRFQMHLEINEDNMLTIRNMPWLDLGELPVSYNTHKTEAF